MLSTQKNNLLYHKQPKNKFLLTNTLCHRYRDSPVNGDPTSVLVNGTPRYPDKLAKKRPVNEDCFYVHVDVFGQCQWFLHCPRYPDRCPVNEDFPQSSLTGQIYKKGPR